MIKEQLSCYAYTYQVNLQQVSKTEPCNNDKLIAKKTVPLYSKLFFSEYLKGLLFVGFVLVYILLVPKMKPEITYMQIIHSKFLRCSDIVMGLLGIVLLAPLWGTVLFFMTSMQGGAILKKENWVGENQRKNQRRILHHLQKSNSRKVDRRQIELSGRLLILYSFNFIEVIQQSNNYFLVNILSYLETVGVDKIPRLINIIQGDISFWQNKNLYELRSSFDKKKPLSTRLNF